MLATGETDSGSCVGEGSEMKSLFVAGILVAAQLQAADLSRMSVLYVGGAGSDRFQHFSSFLRTNVAKLETASLDRFAGGRTPMRITPGRFAEGFPLTAARMAS